MTGDLVRLRRALEESEAGRLEQGAISRRCQQLLQQEKEANVRRGSCQWGHLYHCQHQSLALAAPIIGIVSTNITRPLVLTPALPYCALSI